MNSPVLASRRRDPAPAAVAPEQPDRRPLTTFLPKIGDMEPDRTLRCRVAIASTLIAGLELACDGTVALDQDDAWLPIRAAPRITARRA